MEGSMYSRFFISKFPPFWFVPFVFPTLFQQYKEKRYGIVPNMLSNWITYFMRLTAQKRLRLISYTQYKHEAYPNE